MNQYTVRSGQNIYDVALTLHRTVEGIFDLLISNPELSMETKLQFGDVLNYNEEFLINSDIATWLSKHNVQVKNGEHVCNLSDIESVVKQHIHSFHLETYDALKYKSPDERNEYWNSLTLPRMVIQHKGKMSAISVMMRPDNHLFIDWGDFSGVEVYDAEDDKITIEHCYNSDGEHKITIYGDFSCYILDLTECNGVYYTLAPMRVDHFETDIHNDELNKLITPES